MDAPMTIKRQANWNEEETLVLLHVYRDNVNNLQKYKTNRSRNRLRMVYNDISENLRICGYPRSAREVKKKIDNLIRRYREENSKMSTTGILSNWRFYENVHEVITFLTNKNSSAKIEDTSYSSCNSPSVTTADESVTATSTSHSHAEFSNLPPATTVDGSVTATSTSQSHAEFLNMPSVTIADESITAASTSHNHAEIPNKQRGMLAAGRVLQKFKLVDFLSKFSQAQEQNSREMLGLMRESLNNDKKIISLLKEQNDILKSLIGE